jgi:hypothetical protein
MHARIKEKFNFEQTVVQIMSLLSHSRDEFKVRKKINVER